MSRSISLNDEMIRQLDKIVAFYAHRVLGLQEEEGITLPYPTRNFILKELISKEYQRLKDRGFASDFRN